MGRLWGDEVDFLKNVKSEDDFVCGSCRHYCTSKITSIKRHIIQENGSSDNVFIIVSKMVKLRAFTGAVFSPQDYSIFLKNNI